MRCARQRWRSERGKQVSIALMMPPAPSDTLSSGSPSPRAHVLKEGAYRLGVLLGAGHQVEQDLLALGREAPGRQHRLALAPRPDALGDAVDEEVDDVILAQVPGRELLVVRP